MPFMLVVLTTTSKEEEAERIARQIVDAKLAACVQILPQMTSVYFWEGKVQTEGEHLLLIKTIEDKFEELSTFITQHHSYEVPEIVAINPDRVSEEYLKWVMGVIGDVNRPARDDRE